METLKWLEWRYATKKYNGEKVPQEKVDYILEAARLAPSSSGLQPYKIFVISNRELLEKIKPIAMNQAQITECSHLLVWASWDSYSPEKFDEVFKDLIEVRGLPKDAMDGYKTMLWGHYESRGTEWHANHTARQTYISMSTAMLAAAEVGVDATPMEGFDNAAMDELLGLGKEGLKSQLLLPIGYRDTANDWNAPLKKYRKKKEDLVVALD